ncbi:MAG: glycosyltransferase family 2 protein [Balneolaceae bacterium]
MSISPPEQTSLSPSDQTLYRPIASQVIQKKTAKKLEHISVCICTYLRPEMLVNLIEGLLNQKTYGRFNFSIIIVDNDPSGSAKEVVGNYILQHKLQEDSIKIEYHHEQIKGLTYARNKSIECSSGNYVAFIDDDEVPEPEWLYHLYKTLNDYQADAVFGTVLPKFEVDPPDWVRRQNFFYWRDVRTETGREVGSAVTTNNALVRRDLILLYDLKFDHDFAYTGGEDQAFFFNLLDSRKDAKYISCGKAVVHESITSERCEPEYIRRRHLLEGKGRVFGIYKFSHSNREIIFMLINRFTQSSLRLLVLSLLSVLLFLISSDRAKKNYYKVFYHIGVLSALFNLSPYSDRESIGLL